MSQELFDEFVSNYQTCNQPTHKTNEPFVYVDQEGNIRYVTNVVNSDGFEDEIFAVSVAEDGFMEFLAFQNGA